MADTNNNLQQMEVDKAPRTRKNHGARADGPGADHSTAATSAARPTLEQGAPRVPAAGAAAQTAPGAAPAAPLVPAAPAAQGAAAKTQLAPWKKANKQNEQQRERRLLRETARLALETARMSRAHTAALHHTAIIATEAVAEQAMITAGQEYYENHQRGKKQQAGTPQASSPHIAVWRAIMTKSVVLAAPSVDRDVMKAHMQT